MRCSSLVGLAIAAVVGAGASSLGCHMGLVGVATAGSEAQGPYERGAIAAELGAASVRTMGCLDVGVGVLWRDASELLELHVGNRCTTPEAIAIARVDVRATDGEGAPVPVALVDPRRELRELHVGGAERGRERIRLDGLHRAERVCFGLERIAPDVPAATPAPVCFRRAARAWVPS